MRQLLFVMVVMVSMLTFTNMLSIIQMLKLMRRLVVESKSKCINFISNCLKVIILRLRDEIRWVPRCMAMGLMGFILLKGRPKLFRSAVHVSACAGKLEN